MRVLEELRVLMEHLDKYQEARLGAGSEEDDWLETILGDCSLTGTAIQYYLAIRKKGA